MKSMRTIRETTRSLLTALRTALNLKPCFTLPEMAQRSGLAVEHLDLPPGLDGWLDPGDTPRFISINRNLAPDAQVYVIARSLAFRAQQQGYNSLVLNRPWKWQTLAEANEEIRDIVCQLDLESRAELFMLHFATGDEFRAYVKRRRAKLLRVIFADNIVLFYLVKSRVQNMIFKFFYHLALS